MNRKVTSPKLASEAGRVLQDDNASDISKALAAAVLSQANPQNETGKEMETIASKVLKSEKFSAQNKKFAASLVSQSNRKR